MNHKLIFYCICMLLFTSCIKQINLYTGDDEQHEGGNNDDDKEKPQEQTYLYPFGNEVQGDITAGIFIKVKDAPQVPLKAGMPCLKYNKPLLLLLVQDDCKQSAYCRTWAAINGKPVSNSDPYPTPTVQEPDKTAQLYYHSAHLRKGDLPPNVLPAVRTLGSTDGTGKEVRFAFTTTLSAEEEWMDQDVDVNPGYEKDYYRFFMKRGLNWDEIKEMLNYGVGIAFHDVMAENVNDVEEIKQHYGIAQSKIQEQLAGRKCKMLARPNGNDTYIDAALQYEDIRTMATESNGEDLYPFRAIESLDKVALNRSFEEVQENIKDEIRQQRRAPERNRKAVHIGVHNTDNDWIKLLEWINDNYGKDGDDSVWFPSQEEYYEYNYYRTHGNVKVEQTDEHTIKLTVHLPIGECFYYPSVTVNLSGLKKEDIVSVETDDAVSGLSYNNFEEGIMLNIDCRKHLAEHATHFVEQYEKDRSNASNKADALYFVGMLKDSERKTALLNRIQ